MVEPALAFIGRIEVEMKIAVYPGSFDPVTNGHMDIINRSSKIFDKVIVAVVNNRSKTPLFTVEERMELLKKSVVGLPNVEIDHFEGLLVDFIRSKNAQVIVRGLRAISDFEYEFQMALMNRKLAPEIETVFMMTRHKYSYLSSSIVKEVGSLGGCIKDLVPESILPYIIKKLKKN